MNSSIVIQGHIPDFDPQGNLSAVQKIQLMSLSLEHLRLKNPRACIIVSGHGHRPAKQALDVCNKVFWDDTLYPHDSNGYFPGHPGQNTWVYKGIKAAQEQGHRRILKTRLDSLIGIENIIGHCEEILMFEDKTLLVTQQTCHKSRRLGDCFMYGDTNSLEYLWRPENPVHPTDGLTQLGTRFASEACYPEQLRQTVSFRNTTNLLFMDMRWEYHNIVAQFGTWENFRSLILSGEENSNLYKKYQWGRQWHFIDNNNDMIHKYLLDLISEKEWYA